MPTSQCRLTQAHKSPRQPTQAHNSQRRPTIANAGLRKPMKANAAKQQQGGLETRHVSSPRYVFFSFFIKILSTLLTGVPMGQRRPTQAHTAHDSQRRPQQPTEANAAKQQQGGLETCRVSSSRYVFSALF